MTPPRQVVVDRTYMFTRRCTQRTFLLRPSKKVDQAIVYCFAVAAKRYDLDVYWLSALSNHYHAGLRDKHGNYPEFLRYFHSLLARCLNAHWGRWENLWASEPSSALHLGDNEAIFDKMIYGLSNPALDHLVDRVFHWPGVNSYRYQLADRPMVAKRPSWFFPENSTLPEQIELHFVRPPEYAHLTHEQWAKMIRDAVTDKEDEAREERNGRPVVGRKAILRRSAFSSPESSTERRRLRPSVASKNQWRRIELLQANTLFQRQYRQAYRQLQQADGDHEVLFPHGTYKLWIQSLVRCELPPRE